MLECLIGLVESQTIDKDRAFRNFEEWVLAKFGAGVAKHFMNPYNFKVWATPLKEMGYYWIAERVSVVDWRKAIETTVVPKNTDWGPNAKFGYPLHGGTLGLWKGVVPFLGDDRIRFHKRAVSVDEEKREIAFSDGTTRSYDRLLTTMPLDAFVARLTHAPEKVRAAAQTLLFNRLFSVGVGLRRPSPSDKNWIYFPNPKTPFYRMTYLSNYSPEIVPGGDTSKYFSVLTETSYSKFKPLPGGRLRSGGRRRARRRGDPPAVGSAAHRNRLPHPRRPLVPDPVRRSEPGARDDPRLPRAARHLLARPLRLLEVRDRQPGSLAHAGRRARRPVDGRNRREGVPELAGARGRSPGPFHLEHGRSSERGRAGWRRGWASPASAGSGSRRRRWRASPLPPAMLACLAGGVLLWILVALHRPAGARPARRPRFPGAAAADRGAGPRGRCGGRLLVADAARRVSSGRGRRVGGRDRSLVRRLVACSTFVGSV